MNAANNALLSFLGLCRRAGKMLLGNDVVIDSLNNGESKLVLMASDLSKRTEKGIVTVAQACNIEVIKLKQSKDEISTALGKYSAVVSIIDTGFANKIKILAAQANIGEECNL